MNRIKLTQKFQALFSSTAVREQRVKRDDLLAILKQLKKQSQALRLKLKQSTDPECLKKYRMELAIINAQRDKGITLLRDIKKNLAATFRRRL